MESFPGISEWKTKNIIDMSASNVIRIMSMFAKCNSLISISNISQ